MKNQFLWDYKDYVVLVGLGFIIWLFRVETVAWWLKPTNPTAPTIIHVGQIGPILMKTWPYTVGIFLIIALFVFITIRGEKKLFRAIRFSSFVAICADIIFDVHVQIDPTAGFNADVAKSVWSFMLVIQVTTILGFLLDKGLSWHTYRLQPVLLPYIASAEFMNLAFIAIFVKGWQEMNMLASIGGISSLIESFIEWSGQMRPGTIGCSSWVLGFLICLVIDGVVAIFCWTAFLSKWGPTLVW